MRTGCNEGLLRDDAKLNVLLVAATEEGSPHSANYYLRHFQAHKEREIDVAVHSISADSTSSDPACATQYDSTFEELAEETGGLNLDICDDDWEQHMRDLAGSFRRDLSTFELSGDPIAETIEVTVEGERAEGWSYDAETNTITFEADHVPNGGEEVHVDYFVSGGC